MISKKMLNYVKNRSNFKSALITGGASLLSEGHCMRLIEPPCGVVLEVDVGQSL
jgi:hypothetical protein